TTWMQEILTLIYSKGDPEPTTSIPNWARAPWLEHVHFKEILQETEGPRLLTTHLPWRVLAAALRKGKPKVIYVARNPKDVAVSFYHFHRMANFFPDPGSFDDFLLQFLDGTGAWDARVGLCQHHGIDSSKNGLNSQGAKTEGGSEFTSLLFMGGVLCLSNCTFQSQGGIVELRFIPIRFWHNNDNLGSLHYGSWFQHVKGWLSCQKEMDLFWVTYEELHQQDLRDCVERLSTFLGRPLQPGQIEAIREHSSFASMRENPMVNYTLVPREILDPSRSSFMRKGIVGDWRNHFSAEQSALFNKVFQREMAGCSLSFQGLVD
ncbi:UNVERIFIED_CONTAM: hypothetical protein K2H54_046739, partial [Gekko kuhli]